MIAQISLVSGSTGNFLFFLFSTAILFFAAIRIVFFLLKKVLKTGSFARIIIAWLPAIEAFFWMTFLAGWLHYLENRNSVMFLFLSTILILIIIWIFWIFIRDYLSGLYLRFAYPLKINQVIGTDTLKGKVYKLKTSVLLLETENGNKITIPYSILISKALQIYSQYQVAGMHTFSLSVKAFAPVQQMEKEVKQFILNLPSILSTHPPQIQFKYETENSLAMTITIFAADPVYFPEIEHAVKKQFEK